MKKNYHSNATENELKNGQRFLGIDKQQTTNHKQQTTNNKRFKNKKADLHQTGFFIFSKNE
jgi:hypothetical protein